MGGGGGEDASVTDGPVGCTLGAEGLHPGSFCAALSRCAMLLKHISAGSVDAGPPPEEQGHTIQATGGHLKPYISNQTEQTDQCEEPKDQPNEQIEQMEKTEPTDQPKAKRCKLKRCKKRALSDEELAAVRWGQIN